jgi:hypothetical protein
MSKTSNIDHSRRVPEKILFFLDRKYPSARRRSLPAQSMINASTMRNSIRHYSLRLVLLLSRTNLGMQFVISNCPLGRFSSLKSMNIVPFLFEFACSTRSLVPNGSKPLNALNQEMLDPLPPPSETQGSPVVPISLSGS